MANTKQLRYDGGGTLMFHEPAQGGTGGRPIRRTVRHGDVFETDAETAATLLETDPSIVELDAGGEEVEQAAGTETGTAPDYDSMSAKELKAEAKRRDLSQGGKNADIAARLREDDAKPAAAAAAAQPHPSSSEASATDAPPPDTSGGIDADSVGTDATGTTVGGPESAQVGTAGARGTTSAEAPRSGAVNLGDIPASGTQGPGRS